MFLNPALGAALDRIAERAADVRRAFVPGAQPQRSDVSSSNAAAQFTLDPLSVTAPAGDYFATTDASGTVRYTRDGSFALSDGVLVDARGDAVLGTTDASPGTLAPLRLDPIDAALGFGTRCHIENDGTLAYARSEIDPRSGERVERRMAVGRIALARFPAGTQLERMDPERMGAPAGVVPHTGRPGDGNFQPLEPMRRAAPGVDLDASLERLKEAYLAFDALQAAQTAHGHLSKTAMDLVK